MLSNQLIEGAVLKTNDHTTLMKHIAINCIDLLGTAKWSLAHHLSDNLPTTLKTLLQMSFCLFVNISNSIVSL